MELFNISILTQGNLKYAAHPITYTTNTQVLPSMFGKKCQL